MTLKEYKKTRVGDIVSPTLGNDKDRLYIITDISKEQITARAIDDRPGRSSETYYNTPFRKNLYRTWKMIIPMKGVETNE